LIWFRGCFLLGFLVAAVQGRWKAASVTMAEIEEKWWYDLCLRFREEVITARDY